MLCGVQIWLYLNQDTNVMFSPHLKKTSVKKVPETGESGSLFQSLRNKSVQAEVTQAVTELTKPPDRAPDAQHLK